MTESMIERIADARKAMTELKRLLEVYAPAEHHWKNLDLLLDRIDAALSGPQAQQIVLECRWRGIRRSLSANIANENKPKDTQAQTACSPL